MTRPRSAWALHAGVWLALAVLTVGGAELATWAVLPSLRPGGGVLGALIDGLAPLVVVALGVRVALYGTLLVGVELIVSTLVLVLARPFGAARVGAAHGVAVLVVIAGVAGAETLGRAFEGDLRPACITVYGDAFAVVDVMTETAAEVWVGLQLKDEHGRPSGSVVGRAPVPAGGGPVLVLLGPVDIDGAATVDVQVSATGDDRVTTRRAFVDGTDGDIPLLTARPDPLDPVTLTATDYDAEVARAYLRTLPVAGCARVAAPGERVTVAVTLETQSGMRFPSPTATADADTPAAQCLAHVLDRYGWPELPGEPDAHLVTTWVLGAPPPG